MTDDPTKLHPARVAFWPGLVTRILFGVPAVLSGLAALVIVIAGDPSPGASELLVIAVLFSILSRRGGKPLERGPLEWEARAEDGALVAARSGKRARLDRAWIASGRVEPDLAGLGARVVLESAWAGRVAEVWLPSVPEARVLLGELGLGPLERPATFAFFFGLRVTVGIDGVVVAWPLLRKRRFIAHARIVDVRWTHDRVRLLLAGGESYEFMTGRANGSVGEGHFALVERLVAAREAYAAREGSEPIAALARAGRSHDAWVRELRALSESAGSQYRSASLPAETLWRIALDPAEAPDLRIGASLALRATLDDEGRARLRVAAEASASPRVRVALGAAADELDDDDLARALSGDPPARKATL